MSTSLTSWLRANYRAVTPDCWVSRNRRFVVEADGNDGLGYDFRIPQRGGYRYFEVKAVGGEPTDMLSFELSDPENEFARSHKRTSRYEILVVAGALTDRRRLFGPAQTPIRKKGARGSGSEARASGTRSALSGPSRRKPPSRSALRPRPCGRSSCRASHATVTSCGAKCRGVSPTWPAQHPEREDIRRCCTCHPRQRGDPD